MRIIARARRVAGAVTLLVCAATLALDAFEPPTAPLGQRTASADAVVEAVVTNVQYRLSAAGAGGALPHTFVTFDVTRVIRGEADGPLTLRFLGGLFPDGRFMDDTTAPLFDIGERSLLLLAADTDVDVPLVGARYGRLRIVDGRVYDDFGHPLAFDAAHRPVFGRAVPLPEVADHTLGAFGRPFNPRLRELPRPDARLTPGSDGAGVPHPTVAATLDEVVGWMRALAPSGRARRVTAADPNVPFAARPLPAVRRR